MTITNQGLSGMGLLLSVSGVIPAYLAIGSGSGTEVITATGLYKEFTRSTFTSTDVSVPAQVTWTTDFSTLVMSGKSLCEFGLMTGSPGTDCWDYENLGNAIAFDGTNELRVELTFVKVIG